MTSFKQPIQCQRSHRDVATRIKESIWQNIDGQMQMARGQNDAQYDYIIAKMAFLHIPERVGRHKQNRTNFSSGLLQLYSQHDISLDN
jgi:hypothetical protein